MTDIADILERAADLIEPEGAWTQLAYARDKSGAPLRRGCSDKAVCWCGVGAVEKTGGADIFDESMIGFLDILESALGGDSFQLWNDEDARTQSEVVAKLREAAKHARDSGSRPSGPRPERARGEARQSGGEVASPKSDSQ